MREVNGKYFYGNKISDYGLKNGYVDYGTLARAFNHVLANDIIKQTDGIMGNWEIENGSYEYYEDSDGNRYDYDGAQEKIEEFQEELDGINDKAVWTEEDEERRDEIEREIAELEEPQYDEVFQYFIIDGNGVDILEHWTDEIVWYNDTLDLYVWGVTHYGTSWDYVLTDIKCEKVEKQAV